MSSLQKPKIPPIERWRELSTSQTLTPSAILEVTTETGTWTIEELTSWIDGNVFPGILAEFAYAFLDTVRPILSTVLPLTKENLELLLRPQQFIATDDDQIVRDALVEHFKEFVNAETHPSTHRALAAHIEFGLGNYAESLICSGFAHNEHEVDNFGEKLYEKHTEALHTMLTADAHKARMLADVFNKFAATRLN